MVCARTHTHTFTQVSKVVQGGGLTFVFKHTERVTVRVLTDRIKLFFFPAKVTTHRITPPLIHPHSPDPPSHTHPQPRPDPPGLTAQPARWPCCPSPGASSHLAALGDWRKRPHAAARTHHLGGKGRG